MRATERRRPPLALAAALTCALALPGAALGQGPGTENGNWTYLGGDAWHTRYTTATEITADNFNDLEVVWEWLSLIHI